MLKSLINFFKPPTFPDDETRTRSAYYINAIVLVGIPLIVALTIVRAAMGTDLPSTLILAVLIVVLVIVWTLMKMGFVRAASYLQVAATWIGSTLLAAYGSGVRGQGYASYFIAMLLAGLLLGGRAAAFVGLISILSGFALAYAETLGLIKYQLDPVFSTASEITFIFIISAILIYLSLNTLQNALSNAKQSAQKLVKTNDDLLRLQSALESRVQDRTTELAQRTTQLETANKDAVRRAAQLEALAQVTRSITSIRDLQELLPSISRVISEQFQFYHVGIFLLDEASEFAILSAANSEGGRQMLQIKHRLQVGEQGIVGNVAMTGKPRIAMDVGQDAIYFNNPYLPETHSEMALPLKSGTRVIGVLDVQSTEKNAFSSNDIQLLSLLADQVSLAIENARLFDATQRSLAEAEAFSHQYLHETWGNLAGDRQLPSYRYDVTGVVPHKGSGKLTDQIKDGDQVQKAEASQVRVPIELRGEIIGSLVVNPLRERKWTQDELDLIKAVADRVAISAENARLFEESNRRAERERLVSDITRKIRSFNDPQTMIQTAVEELRNALGASHVEILPQKVTDKNEQ